MSKKNCAACMVPWANPPRRHTCGPRYQNYIPWAAMGVSAMHPAAAAASGAGALAKFPVSSVMKRAGRKKNPGTLADGAESWARKRGITVPARGSATWKGMFAAWQRAGMASNPAKAPPKGTRKHKTNCTCVVCRHSAKSSAVRRLDHFITHYPSLRKLAQQTQGALLNRMRSGRYSPATAPDAWLRVVNAGVKKFAVKDRSILTIFTRAYRHQVATKIAREFEQKVRAHRNPAAAGLATGLVEGVAGGAAFAATQHLIKKRLKNPGLAIVGAGLANPPRRHKNYSSSPGSATAGPKTDRNKRGDRGLRRVITLGEARQIAARAGKTREFNAAVRAHMKFHGYRGSLPDDYPVFTYAMPDGSSKTTLKIGSATGRVPETTYHRTPEDSNKAGKFWVHEHPPGGEPLEVWLPLEKIAVKIGGTMTRGDWYRS